MLSGVQPTAASSPSAYVTRRSHRDFDQNTRALLSLSDSVSHDPQSAYVLIRPGVFVIAEFQVLSTSDTPAWHNMP